MILNLRGTSGSGKSFVIKQWLADYCQRPLYGCFGTRAPEAYLTRAPGVVDPIYVLGPYHSPCGGCDAVQPYSLILDLLSRYGERGHVLFEGLFVSSSYGSVCKTLEPWGQDAVLLFLNTPLEVCLEHVRQRRATRGDCKPFNEANTRDKFAQIVGLREKLASPLYRGSAQTFTVLETSAADAVPLILQLLQRGSLGEEHGTLCSAH